ncbi:GTPase family protein [Arthrobacter sp. AOP36-C1-22]|uniref:GTPase family protein n=1 Tax=Arthrobacter sp. AOP36-C1-22 TaxID=3457683 RepID=UPI00403327EE
MSRRGKEAVTTPLIERLEALQHATELGTGRVPQAQIEKADAVLEQASTRRSLSAEHTVVGFFGATGSGKSSLFNAVTGRDLARAAATRPTTSVPLAGVWQAEGSDDLLDWLQVPERHQLDQPLGTSRAGLLRRRSGQASGLILVDLPDFDSTTAGNRETAERLAGQVDVLVWVLDPQKYADAAVHHEFIRPLAAYAGITLVVLNQIDLLDSSDRTAVIESLRGILETDGLRRPRLHAVSAKSGEGIDGLREAIADVAVARSASTDRLLQDVAAAADGLVGPTHPAAAPESGAGEDPAWAIGRGLPEPGTAEQRALADHLADASGVETVVAATRTSYRLQARGRTGWPVTRWLSKLRPDPLRRLNLRSRDVNPAVNRTSLPAPGAAQRAQSDSAVRVFADGASKGAPEAWRGSIRRAARASSKNLPDALDQAIASTDISAGRGSWWWPVVSVVQWAALAVALAGAGWLAVLAIMGYLQFDAPAAPRVEGFPVPTLMLVGGVLLGIVLGLVTGLLARAAASGRARRARRELRASITRVAQDLVVEPVNAEVSRFNNFGSAVRRARG